MLITQSKKKKTDYDAEILYIKSKYFSTADYNKFTSEKPDLKIKKKKKIVSRFDIAGLINNTDLDKEVATLATKAKFKSRTR